mgnify:FL=1
MSAENTELEDLEQLVSMPGWGRFIAMVDEQWSRSSDKFYDAVTAAAKGDNPHAADHLRQILASQREIQGVMALVVNRIKLLKTPQLVSIGAPLSRRGGL